MKLITYHGTILRHTATRIDLSHHPLLVREPDFIDAEFGALNGATTSQILSGGPIEIVPGGVPGTVHLTQAGLYMCAEPHHRILKSNRKAGGIWETFLALDDTDVVVLRWILGSGWRVTPGAGFVEGSLPVPIVPNLLQNFLLRIGRETINLVSVRPRIQSLTIPAFGPTPSGHVLDRVEDMPIPAELALIPAPVTVSRLPLVGPKAFLEGTDRAIVVPATPEECNLPITADISGSEFVILSCKNKPTIQIGWQNTSSEVRRARGKYVLLQQYCAGIMFDENGTYSEAGYLQGLGQCPSGLRRDGRTIILDKQLMHSAKHIAGPSAVIFNPHMRNYYHWMVECMLSLDMVARFLPSETKIILPGEVALYRATGSTGFDHRRIMNLLGFDHIPVIELETATCYLEEAIWVENYMLHLLPADALRVFRDRVMHRMGGSKARNQRIYIQRTGMRAIANDAEVQAFCSERGFTTYRLEETDDEEQIRAFQDAAFIIAPHGAGLANLIFCQPGTKVIELSPEQEFRPFFWQISEKLGLVFAVLPCSTSDGTFQGNITVEVSMLNTLYKIMEGETPTIVPEHV